MIPSASRPLRRRWPRYRPLRFYRYQLLEPASVDASRYVRPPRRAAEVAGFVALYPTGRLCLEAGYAWNGPSGWPRWWEPPRRLVVASLWHDALWQLVRVRQLPHVYRLGADRLLRDVTGGLLGTAAFGAVRLAGPFVR